MTHPTVIPDRLGAGCWETDRPDQLLQWVARVDASYASSFLACHSPFLGIGSTDGRKSETEVFDWLSERTSLETLVVVTGEPGSGKSHFINWLKLRLDDALARDEMHSIKSVMIKRRSGSLRDALEQLVEQLPDFHHYLDPIKAAIESLTGEFARRELCFKISQLLHQSRLEDRRLRELHGLFQDMGSQGWLCRDGGAIDRNIQRLISQSRIDEREDLPLFTAEDFLIKDPALLRQAGESVTDLIDIIESDEQKCLSALTHTNSFLRTALEMLTGLGNQTLHQIFRSIREDLKQQGQRLALFIEDVSTLSALDVEVVNVLEPQNDPTLCQLYGVVGMTNQALQRLPENMRGRISLELEIKGGDDEGPLLRDPDNVDKFIARYLNALRLGDTDVDRIANYRRQGFDVRLSACEECDLQDKCFAAFGMVEIEEQKIGLFPFRPGTAYRLLQGLRVEGSIRRNPRGLLQQILTPVIGTIDRGIERAQANMGLPVEPMTPMDMSAVSGRYLGGWDEKSKQRLSYLLWYWTGFKNLDQGIGALEIIRGALNLPSFSQAPPPPKPAPDENSDENPASPDIDSPPVENPQYIKLLNFLENWASNNEPLKQDKAFREVLWPLIKTSIPWEERRVPAEPGYRRVSQQNIGAVQIEDMNTRSATSSLTFPFFPRSEETSELLRSSLRFNELGKKTWKYSDPLQDRRLIGRWLRGKTELISRVPDPIDLDPKDACDSALHFLILAYQFSQRKALPGDYSDAVNDLFSFEALVPAALSRELDKLAQDLPDRVDRIRKFLVAELNVPQGAGGIVFIDPLPIIWAIQSYKSGCAMDSVDERFGESYWAPRFKAVVDLGKSSWSTLEEALATEVQQFGSVYAGIRNHLAYWDLKADSMPDRIEEFFKGCQDVKLALRETKQAMGDTSVDNLFARNDNPVAKWRKVLGEVEELTESEKPIDILRFRTEDLIDLENALEMLESWAKELDNIFDEKYKSGTGGGDLDEEIRGAHTTLDSFSVLLDQGGADVED